MDIAEAVRSCFRNYAVFSGRAQRSEFWWWQLFVVVVSLVLSILPPLSTIWTLAVFIPGISVSVRRLHDIGKTGWFVLLPLASVPIGVLGRIIEGGILVPVAGVLALAAYLLLIVWFCTDGTPGPNRFGPDPKGRAPGDAR